MRKTAKYSIGAAAVFLLVAGGVFLPGELARGSDRRILGQIRGEPLDAAELADYVNLLMADKASLLNQMRVPLETGANFDQDTVITRFLEERRKLQELGFFPAVIAGGQERVRAAAALYLQSDAPSINMIFWELDISAGGISGTCYMDDQTGKILSFDLRGRGYEDCIYRAEMTETLASYLETEIKNTETAEEGINEAGVRQNRYVFELTSGTGNVGGQMYSYTEAGASNRWVLNYPGRGGYDLIFSTTVSED